MQARIAECLEKDDFQGAGVLKARIQELDAKPKVLPVLVQPQNAKQSSQASTQVSAVLDADTRRLQEQLSDRVEKEDIHGAAVLKAQLRELGARNLQPCGTVIQQLQARKAACLMHEDFLGAAAIQAQLQEMEAKPDAHLESVDPEVTKQPAESSMREAAALDAETKPMEEQLSDCGQKEKLGARHQAPATAATEAWSQ